MTMNVRYRFNRSPTLLLLTRFLKCTGRSVYAPAFGQSTNCRILLERPRPWELGRSSTNSTSGPRRRLSLDALPQCVLSFSRYSLLTLLLRLKDDVLATLLTALEARARLIRSRPGMSSIFLLNNISFIRREVLSSQIGDLLGEACEDSLNKKMRSSKALYLEIWSPLVSAILDAGIDQSGAAGAIKAGIGAVKGGGEKRETKDRFMRFHDAFEEIEQLHATSKLDEGEAELRERLKGEVQRMVLPTFTKFLARHRNGEFSKS